MAIAFIGENGPDDDTSQKIELTPLGSNFKEISASMISLIVQKYNSMGNYGRNWGDYSYTDLGLDPNDWKDPVEHIIYKPGGSDLRIKPEDGYSFTVNSISGEEKILKASYNWDLVYNNVNKKWYYHSVAESNEIDINTLNVINK